MQVQKGLVKYKDRSDILCTYGITDDGKTYYFLEGNTIPNGNIVATTVLVEAIDPLVVSSSIGVIDPEGNIVIPFENKAVKTLSNDLLLVEKGTPVSESVLEAVELRSDPSAASKLVSTPAAIKETMHVRMGESGRFVFNDQFSEATICDINGNNLVNDELFSFIGVNEERMFLCKNVVGSFIWEFDIVNKKLDVMPEEEAEVTMGDGDVSEFTVNVNDIPTVEEETTEVGTEVGETEEVVEENLESGFSAEDFVAVENPEIGTDPVEEETEVSTETVDEVIEESEEIVENVEVVEKTSTEGVISEEETIENDDLFIISPEEETEDIFASAKVKEDTLVTSDTEEYDEYSGFTYFPEHTSKDNLVQEVTATINELVRLNKTQRQKLISYEQRMDQMAEANRKMNDKIREQSKDYEKLRATAENFKTVVGKLEAKCEVLEGKNEALESKTHDQERTIYRLTAENTSLREQNLSNEALAQVLAEARSALDSDDVDLGYYRKAA